MNNEAPGAPQLPPKDRKKLTPQFERSKKDRRELRERQRETTQERSFKRKLKFDGS